MPRKLGKNYKKMKKKVKKEPDWQQIIALSAAGQYIQNRLNEELEKIKPIKKYGRK